MSVVALVVAVLAMLGVGYALMLIRRLVRMVQALGRDQALQAEATNSAFAATMERQGRQDEEIRRVEGEVRRVSGEMITGTDFASWVEQQNRNTLG